MAANPQIPQGVLNKLRGTVIVNANPSLNVTPSYLGRGGISLAFTDQATVRMKTMTGVVTSGEPYQDCVLTLVLLKSQGFAQRWETQRQTQSTIGDLSITTDSSTLSNFDLVNCSIENVSPLSFNGEVAEYVVTIGGVYLINSSLWSPV